MFKRLSQFFTKKGDRMITLTEDQIKTAIEKTWTGLAGYMLEKFFPRMKEIGNKELLPEGLVVATALAVEDVFSEGYPPALKQQIYKILPDFFKNLELGDEGEKAITFFNEAISNK